MSRTTPLRPEEISAGLGTILPLFILVFAVGYAAWDSAYTVQPYERAVVFRVGKIIETTEPGLHFKVPFFDEVVFVNVQEQEQRLPYNVSPNGTTRSFDDEQQSLMLTGDLNAAVVEWTIQYRVVDPAKTLVSIDFSAIDRVIFNVSRSVMHQVIGDYSIDEVLTSKRTEVGNAAREALQQTLDGYDSGIQITGLQMQRVTPPALVKPAFDEVNASVQRRDQLINEANRERNMLIPTAEAEKDRLIRDAEGYASRRRAETEGEIAALIERYNAYKQAPEVTRQRLYLEAMESILTSSGSKVILDDGLQGLLPMLNLNEVGQEGVLNSARSNGEVR